MVPPGRCIFSLLQDSSLPILTSFPSSVQSLVEILASCTSRLHPEQGMGDVSSSEHPCECSCPLGSFPAPGLGTSSWALAQTLVAWTPLSICWVQWWAEFPPLLGPPHSRAPCYGHCPLSRTLRGCHLLALLVIALVFLPLNKCLFSRPVLQPWLQV